MKPLTNNARTAIIAIVGFIVAIWIIEIVDTVILSSSLQSNGIQPRKVRGLDGILWHPFLHSNFGHVISNSLPFIVLGGFVGLRGFTYWLNVTVVGGLLGGSLTWLLGGSGNHIGASGIVFAYFGAILGAALFERKPASMAVGLVVIMLYSSMFIGLFPQVAISWEGHLFGFISGVVIARIFKKPKEPIAKDPYPEVWGGEEPWLS